jgi:hypothetical protein
MRRVTLAVLALAPVAVVAALVQGPAPSAGTASSHREAPSISEDPTADNTDLYAFRSPDRPDTVTIISNVIPAEDPAAGPMYYEFSPSARYNVYVDRNGDGRAEITYRFAFRPSTRVAFLRNTVQPYTVTRIENGRSQVVATGNTPPNNIGPRTTPGYRQLAQNAVVQLTGGGQVFAGQRDDAFFGDIGAIFDSVGFRRGSGNAGGGRDFFAGYGVHTLSLQLPISSLADPDGIVGVWTSVERQQLRVQNVARRAEGKRVRSAVVSRPWVQVSRLGNPLVNEAIIPTTQKDAWNRSTPSGDSRYVGLYTQPVLAALINQLYPGVVNAPERDRDDLVAVLLTGVPNLNFTGRTQADLLRLNLSVAPTAAVGAGNRLGVFGNDLAGFPNGRRLEDDVIDIAERAVAGKLKGNPNADALGDGVNGNDVPFLTTFPYQADPFSGFENTKGQQKP